MKQKRILAAALTCALTLSLTACGNKPTEPTPTPEAESPAVGGLYTAGTYTATTDGRNGPLTLEVVLTADTIESVTILEHSETAGVADPAIERIPTAIVDAQSLAIDTIGGATITSEAILLAAEDCIAQAGGDVNALKQPLEKENTEKNTETRSADVVVVGSGLSGLSAALAAADEGASVVVLERMAVTGGTSATSGGYLICLESQLYENADTDDSLETFMAFWDDLQGQTDYDTNYPDRERTELIFGQTGATVDWLASKGIT